MRAHGLSELFNDVGRNRLRLYRDLPIFYAAERDGALREEWEEGDEGASRRKGYTVEHPWRFLDARTRLAYELALGLRDRLGTATELAQLAAAADLAEQTAVVSAEIPRIVKSVLADVAAFEALTARLAGKPRAAGEAERGASERAAEVIFAGACNNGCPACPNRERWVDDREESLLARVDEARISGLPVVLAGREPTVHPAFARLVQRARGDDGRRVGVVTNGRLFAYERFARAAAAAGLSAASVKVFAPDAEAAGEISRDPAGHAQALEGLRRLRAAGVPALELRAPLHQLNLTAGPRWAEVAASVGIGQLRVETALDAVGLDRLKEAGEALLNLVRRCREVGIAVEVSPLAAGTRWFARIPAVSTRGDRRRT